MITADKMGTVTFCLAAALSFLFLAQYASGLDLDSFLVDTLDSTMLALEKDRATKDLTKLVTVPRVKTRYTKMKKAGGKLQTAKISFEIVIVLSVSAL